jgi:hypothetical protein
MLWHKYPEKLDSQRLQAAYQTLEGDSPSKIPFIVWLLENPESRLALPGSIDLYGHDCLHLLLKQGFTAANEAYVVGFSMGNDAQTRRIHVWIFKLAAQFLYPRLYRLSSKDFQLFWKGFELGKKVRIKNFSQLLNYDWQSKTLQEIRLELGITNSLVMHPSLP